MKKRHNYRKGEWFNFDKAIFLLLVLSFIAIIRAITSAETGTIDAKAGLEQEAMDVLNKITNENTPVGLLKSNELLEERVEYLEQIGYNKIKNMVGIKSDFCIFFEDVTGSLVHINGVKSGIGSRKIYINGEPCK